MKTASLLMTLVLLALLVLSGATPARPASPRDVKLWPGGAPGAKGTGNNDTPTLTIFPPPWDTNGPAPAVLLIPGADDKNSSTCETFRKFFQTRPVQFFSLKYRLPANGCRHPAPLQDAQRAVRTIRANATKWNIDPKRLLVVAFSSGGHVATTLATHSDPGSAGAKDPVEQFSCRPDYMALFSPLVSVKNNPNLPFAASLLGPDPDAKLIDELSGELHVTSNTPPTFLAYAQDDTLVPPSNSIQYHDALKKAGVAAKLEVYRKGGHDVMKKPNPWKAQLGDWMSENGILPEGVARPLPESTQLYDPTTSYTVKDLAGWKVYIHNSLLPGGEHAETGAAAIKRLTEGMNLLKTWMPRKQLAKLLTVTIWLEWSSTNGPWGGTSAYQYHPGIDWLIDMDFNPAKHKCVEFGNAASLSRRSIDSTADVLLHELAHAYHDQVLTFQDPDILAAYKRCCEGTAYPQRDWVKSDHKEFFSGVTQRYFGIQEQRDTLYKRDPVLVEYLRKTWDTPLATMTTRSD